MSSVANQIAEFVIEHNLVSIQIGYQTGSNGVESYLPLSSKTKLTMSVPLLKIMLPHCNDVLCVS